jgi:hypothetical protein
MDDAITELSTVKFWVLAMVSVFLSIAANLITDWIKSRITMSLTIFSEKMSGSPIWASNRHAFIVTLLVMLSYLAQQTGQYWQPLLMVFFLAVARANSLAIDLLEKKKISPTSILLLTSNVFLETYIVLWGAPRLAYWATAFNLVSVPGAITILFVAFLCQWLLAKKKYGNKYVNTA